MGFREISKIVTSLVIGVTLSYGSGILVSLQGTEGQPDKELGAMVKKLDSIGFEAVGKNEHIETHYYNKYKEKNLDLLNFYPVIDKKSMRELLLANPDFGAYTPFNLLAFKKIAKDGGDTTWYGHLDADTMLEIIGEKDEANKKKFKNMVIKLDNFVTKEMKPTKSKKLTFDGELPAKPLLKMVMKFDRPDDIEEFVEDFIMKHDGLFAKKEFVIAGFLDLKFEYGDMNLDFDKYDAYWVSSLCHFGFSNSVFNHGDPQAGVFAPCSVYFYIPKGQNELHVGYATVDNWITTTGIKESKKVAYMREISDSVKKTFEELGFTQEDSILKKTNIVNEAKSTKKVIKPTSSNSLDIHTQLIELKEMVTKLTKEVHTIKKILDED